MIKNTIFGLAILSVIAGCASQTTSDNDTTAAEPVAPATIPDQSDVPPAQRLRVGPEKEQQPSLPEGPPLKAMSFGRGVAGGDDFRLNFRFSISEYQNGTVEGWFEKSSAVAAGTIDIDADVTCVVLDSEADRGWVGGKIKRNASTNPLYAGAIGTDVWFWFAGNSSSPLPPVITGPVLRSGDIRTAEDFCEKQPWSETELMAVGSGALGIFP